MKESLLAEFARVDDPASAATVGVKAPYFDVEFDFVLSRPKAE